MPRLPERVEAYQKLSAPRSGLSEPTYSVSELNAQVQTLLHRQFPRLLWVRGEIQGYDLRKHRDTVSFTLAEKSAVSDDVLASVTTILFADERKMIVQLLEGAENAFQLQDGIEVRFRVELDLWVKAGRFQLRVRGIDPTYTLGRLAQNRRRTIEQLTQRRLLDRNKSLSLALVPLRVGLIAAKGSAGFTDFLTHLSQSRLNFHIQFRDATMQGSQVEGDVCRAIRHFNDTGSVDVIVLTRGGGSSTDLSWFDRMGLAEAIAHCPIPVLTGLGHAHDTSVADLVAHAHLKTPTDVAQFLIDRVFAFLDTLEGISRHLAQAAEDLLLSQRMLLVETGQSLSAAAQSFVTDAKLKLAGNQRDLTRRSEGLLDREWGFLKTSTDRFNLERIEPLLAREYEQAGEITRCIAQRFRWLIQRDEKELTQLRQSYSYPRINRAILRERLQLEAALERIRMADPIKTLRRGFSITRDAQGTVVSSVVQLKPNESLTTELSDGYFRSVITDTELRDGGFLGGGRQD